MSVVYGPSMMQTCEICIFFYCTEAAPCLCFQKNCMYSIIWRGFLTPSILWQPPYNYNLPPLFFKFAHPTLLHYLLPPISTSTSTWIYDRATFDLLFYNDIMDLQSTLVKVICWLYAVRLRSSCETQMILWIFKVLL